MNNTYVLLLTASIKPQVSNNNLLSRKDPLIRLDDYKTAIKYWLEYPDERIKGIVFVENSGFNLNLIKEVFNSQNRYTRDIEILQYVEKEQNFNVHYGYYEYKMLDYSIKHSNIIKNADYIIKITGRLTFKNLTQLINYQDIKSFDFFSDCRDYTVLNKIQNHSILTTLMIYSKAFYLKYLYNNQSLMLEKQNYYLEQAFFNQIKPLIESNNVMIRFPFNVDPKGIGGHSNISYNSFSYQWKSLIRAFARKIIPQYHI